MLIREEDGVFDLIRHGFWVYPAIAVTMIAIAFAIKQKGTTLHAMAQYCQTPSCITMSLALITLLVFSRLMGMGDLWQQVLQGGYVRTLKNIVEEGIELLAYGFILFSAWQTFLMQLAPQWQLQSLITRCCAKENSSEQVYS